ncbi:MAG: methyltransferase domain-containing protein [Chlorobi bacterium]|nr:methyltransferase domain-containing protein [Chlorobiota bacterium]NOG68607.1 N-6 DNA methylase [Chlorobiota bacterium]
MLDNITKKNIDDCRDVLVGKVPDPKSQIEQITLALIYKFMDDMDKEAVEKFKGKAKFFTGEYAKYGWRKLFDPSLSGQDMLSLYSEALEKLNTNPNIPELFRNIFKNAYLPYRDPATLKLFLKHINEFEYSHSEKLGDAFEYLLSVMGSQGDAGQFRTPRHIIDFVTACVNPQKNETVLDPACGTAGFLLSAYKHILNQNTEKRLGDKLKPDDRKKLATNFVGYDISPDMVRLSLANMYLHGFATPQIHEYDTLSSEDRWQETFDVILANPPFMTPKGGIRPHKRFSVNAKKSEVLFVDYIVEHLNTNGRAGIIVPEGIIFQNGSAYSNLRKIMLDNNLCGIVSLPVGVFNPYTSTTKTSILLFDKKIRNNINGVFFIKVNNDGFELGSERKPIDENDLPTALEIINNLRKDKTEFPKTDTLSFTILTKREIEARTGYNLAVLNDVEEIEDENYDNIEIGKILNPIKKTVKLDDNTIYKQITVKMNGKGVVLRQEIKGDKIKTKSQFLAEEGNFIMSKIDARNGAFGIVPSELNGAIVTQDFPLFKVNNEVMLPEFLNVVIQSPQFIKICQTTSVGTSNRRRLKVDKFLKSRIPLPNIDEQREFLTRINLINSKISSLKMEIENLDEEMKNEILNVWTAKEETE